jgi:hypothetical protein
MSTILRLLPRHVIRESLPVRQKKERSPAPSGGPQRPHEYDVGQNGPVEAEDELCLVLQLLVVRTLLPRD